MRQCVMKIVVIVGNHAALPHPYGACSLEIRVRLIFVGSDAALHRPYVICRICLQFAEGARQTATNFDNGGGIRPFA